MAYILDRSPDKIKVIKDLSSKLSVGTYSTDGRPFGMEAHGQGDPTVEGWLASIHDASFVVTDSFHGTVFSILFNKPFIAYGNPHRGMARFTSLLKMLGLEDRLVIKSSETVVERALRPIDWNAVNQRLGELRTQSMRFLNSALSKGNMNRTEARPPVSDGGKAPFSAPVVLDRPVFSANSEGWRIEFRDGLSVLNVAPGAAVRGNHVWCELPYALSKQKTYRLSLTWHVRTAARSLDVHIRNRETGLFRPIGRLAIAGRKGDRQVDVFDFMAPGEGFNQFMLGAAYFTGADAGADIVEISLRAAEVVKAEAEPAPPSYLESVQKLALSDSKRYADAFVQSDATRGIGLIHARMMFYAHALEKGLSRTDFRPRFGGAVIRSMADEMARWLEVGRSKNDQFFKTAAATAHAYFERHRQLGVDAADLFKAFDPASQALIMKAEDDDGGVLSASSVREPLPETNRDRKFIDVVFGRRSIRNFIDAPVDDEDIRRAVKIAQQAPSVCNRQAPRVHQFEDPDAIRASLDLQGGFKGYEMPPRLLLVTTDLTAFLSPNERNQGFVDGGLFMMGLLLGLEQVGLGACPLNTALSLNRENGIRKILDIPKTEIFISFIAVGHFDSSVLTPRSKRIPIDDVLVAHRMPVQKR